MYAGVQGGIARGRPWLALEEAEMMVDHVAAMAGDLRAHGALPSRLERGGASPASRQEAALNARALLSGYTTPFPSRKALIGCCG